MSAKRLLAVALLTLGLWSTPASGPDAATKTTKPTTATKATKPTTATKPTAVAARTSAATTPPATTATIVNPANAPAPQSSMLVVNPGAVLEIAVYAAGEKELEFTATVAPDSTIMVPLAGRTRVGGLTPVRIAERLQAVLGQDYLVNPQALVNVREYGGRVLVWGEVRQPGLYPLGQGLSALAAVVQAGGFTDFASTGKARVVRTNNGKPEVMRVDFGKILKGTAEDFALRDGDRIEVPRRLF